nr:hypothetical protein [Tanacetum cinerariifolium]
MPRRIDIDKTDVGEGLGALAVLSLLASYPDSVSIVDSCSEFGVGYLDRLAVCPDSLAEWMVRGDKGEVVYSTSLSMVRVKYSAYARRIVVGFLHVPPNEYSPRPNDK